MLVGLCCVGCGDRTTMLAADSLIELTDSDKLRVHVIRPQLTKNAAKTVVCYGKFRPVQQSRLQFGRPGIVSKLLKKIGDSVSTGELLAELEQDDLNSQLTNLEASLKETQESIKTLPPAEAAKQSAKIKQLEGQLIQLKGQLAGGVLTADLSGVVVKNELKVGSMAVPGRNVLIIADKQNPVVDISLNSDIAENLADNQSIWVGHNGTALVTSIQSREIIQAEDGAERVTLEFTTPLDADDWSYDSVVEVRYRRFEKQSGYWIPMTALHRTSDGNWNVLVAESVLDKADVSVLRKQACEVIRHQNDQVLVTSANLEDMRLVVDGSHRVVEGQAVVAIESLPDDSGAFRPSGNQ